MLGSINKEITSKELLRDFPEVTDIYADMSFDFSCKDVRLFILHEVKFDTVKFLYRVREIFGENSKIYTTTDCLDTMFYGKRLVYRKGRWYI